MDVHEYEGDAAAFWSMHADVDDETRAAIDRLRPARPFWIPASDPDALRRWSVCWRLAAAYALSLELHDDERELRLFVWSSARALHSSAVPTGEGLPGLL